MDTNKSRSRGRPKGSGKDDSKVLAEIANILIAEEECIPPTTAMKRAGVTNPSDIRRLQVKWQVEGETYLNRARALQERQRTASSTDVGQDLGFYDHDPIGARAGANSAFDRMMNEQQRVEKAMRPFLEAQKRADRLMSPILQAQRRAEETLRPILEAQRRADEMMSPIFEEQRRLDEFIRRLRRGY